MRALLPVLAAALPLAAAGAAKQKVAVLDVRAVQGVVPGTAAILGAIVVDGAAKAFDVISQSDVAAMLGFEKQKQMLGCAEDSSCLAEIGGALGVDYVLSGQVGQIGSRYHLSLQLLDARKARVISRAARFADHDDDALAAAAQGAIDELVAGAAAQARGTAPPPAAGERRASPDLAARPPAAGLAAARPPRPFWSTRAAGWATLGAGLALAAGGAWFGLQARSARSALADGWQRADYASFYDSKSSEARRDALVANVLYGAGAAAGAAGAWLLVRNWREPWTAGPLLAEGAVGVAAAGRF